MRIISGIKDRVVNYGQKVRKKMKGKWHTAFGVAGTIVGTCVGGIAGGWLGGSIGTGVGEIVNVFFKNNRNIAQNQDNKLNALA